MGKETLMDKFRIFVACIGFRIFLWAINMTSEQYYSTIVEDAIQRGNR